MRLQGSTILDKKIKNPPTALIVIALCLYLPFIESWFSATLWGLNWDSPVLMAQLNSKLKLVKLIFIVIGVALLITKNKSISDTFNNTIIKYVFLVSSYLVAAIQIPLLCLGILFHSNSSSNLDYLHQEKTFNNRSIYVYTADPGAMGRAYHYFYLKCQLAFNRYDLKLIKKMDWMYDYSFEVKGNNLVVTNQSEENKSHVFDITNFTCHAGI